MRNRKQNTSFFLRTAILARGPAREWKNPLCMTEEEHLLLHKGAPAYTQWKERSGKDTKIQLDRTSQEHRTVIAELLKLHHTVSKNARYQPLPHMSYPLHLTQPGQTKEAISIHFLILISNDLQQVFTHH